MECYLLEKGNDEEFRYFRRPGIVRMKNGKLIVYYEGQHLEYPRYQTLFYRLSCDGGKSWGKRISLVSGGETGILHNLMMVQGDERLHCLWNVQYRQLWHMSSKDGINWSEPRDLTRALWRAETEYPWNAFGIGSGHGIRLRNGRILIPTWFTTGGDSHKPSGFANIYTDDEFKTIKIGNVLQEDKEHKEIKNPNEGTVVELRSGKVLASVRHDCKERQRAICYSDGGVEKWSEVIFRKDLPDPICHAAFEKWNDQILFCNCANEDPGIEEKKRQGLCKYNWSDDARKNLTLRISNDEGRSFSKGVCLAEKGGYNDLAVSEDKVICVFETGWNESPDTCIFPNQLGIAIISCEELQE